MTLENAKSCKNYCEKLGVVDWVSEVSGCFELAVF